MLTRSLILAVAATALASTATAAIQWTPATVRSDVARDGAKSVVGSLWGSGQWKTLEADIKSGDGDWIALAPILKPGTDAGASEGLTNALTYALPKNPRAVLAALAPGDGEVLSASRVCAAEFYEGTKESFIRRYRRAAIAAVSKPVPPGLARRRRDCLAALKASR